MKEGASYNWIFILGVNLIPLVGVLLFNWSVLELFTCYLTELLIVGILNLFKMAKVESEEKKLKQLKWMLIPFFIFHFSLFFITLEQIFYWAVRYLEGKMDVSCTDIRLNYGEPMFPYYSSFLGIGLLFLLFYSLRFIFMYLGQQHYKKEKVGALMFQPYELLVGLFIIRVLIEALLYFSSKPSFLVFSILVLKVVLDYLILYREKRRHKKFSLQHKV